MFGNPRRLKRSFQSSTVGASHIRRIETLKDGVEASATVRVKVVKNKGSRRRSQAELDIIYGTDPGRHGPDAAPDEDRPEVRLVLQRTSGSARAPERHRLSAEHPDVGRQILARSRRWPPEQVVSAAAADPEPNRRCEKAAEELAEGRHLGAGAGRRHEGSRGATLRNAAARAPERGGDPLKWMPRATRDEG
jgi:hypothetical protein